MKWKNVRKLVCVFYNNRPHIWPTFGLIVVINTLVPVLLSRIYDPAYICDVARTSGGASEAPIGWHRVDVYWGTLISFSGIRHKMFEGEVFSINSFGDIKPFSLVVNCALGFPFPSHSYTALRSFDGSVILFDKSGIYLGGFTIPMLIRPFEFVLNVACTWMPISLLANAGCRAWQRIYRRQGCCTSCGYELESGCSQCSECGMPK